MKRARDAGGRILPNTENVFKLPTLLQFILIMISFFLFVAMILHYKSIFAILKKIFFDFREICPPCISDEKKESAPPPKKPGEI